MSPPIRRAPTSVVATPTARRDGAAAALRAAIEPVNILDSTHETTNLTQQHDTSTTLAPRRSTETPTSAATAAATAAAANFVFDPEGIDSRPPSLFFTCPANIDKHKPFLATYQQGKFLPEEAAAVDRELRSYLTQYNIPESAIPLLLSRRTKIPDPITGTDVPNPYVDPRYNNVVRTVHLGARINRSLHQVAVYMKRRYALVENRGVRWTKDEDEQLLHLVRQRGGAWADISRLLRRHDVRRRYTKLVRKLNLPPVPNAQ